MARNVVRKLADRLPKAKVAFAQLSKKDVLVGVPREDAQRKKLPDEPKQSMNNATLAYIHDNGSPAAHIPARPFMRPGVEAVKALIIDRFKRSAQGAVSLKPGADPKIEQTLHAVGLVTQASIRKTIGQGIPPPLAPSTIAQRFRQRGTKSRRKAELKYMDLVASGVDEAQAQSDANIVALVNTGQLRNSINYVIREKGSK